MNRKLGEKKVGKTKRPYQILSLSMIDEMTNIGLTFVGKHLELAKESPVLIGTRGTPGIF